MRDADEAVALAMRAEPRLRDGAQPTPFAVGTLVDAFQREGLGGAFPGNLLLQNAGQVIGMDRAAPIIGERFIVTDAEEFLIGEIRELARTGGGGHPDRHWRAVGNHPETLF